MNPRIIWCPPAGESSSFDSHQFANRKIKSLQLSFDDMARAHVLHVADKKPGRRLPTPDWAMSDEALREVLAFYLEGRLFLRSSDGTPHERLAKCRAAAELHVVRKRRQLQKMIEKYREFARLPSRESGNLRLLEQQIGNLDTEIFIAAKLPEIVCSAAYLYHRLCWNSVSVAEHLGITPCHVRQILYRLRRAAERMARAKIAGAGAKGERKRSEQFVYFQRAFSFGA